jgi:hypothetical protein
MIHQTHRWVVLTTLSWLLGCFAISEVAARSTSNFGPAVDAYCLAVNGQTPYQDQGCALCHTSNLKEEVLPQWDWWRNSEFGNFCPDAINSPPESSIVAPATDLIISAGDRVVFQGTGSDPDGDTALRYKWDFAGAAPASNLQNPGEILFSSAGDYTVSLNVTDSHGLADPTPAQRRISVLALQVCTDADGDGFNVQGDSCGARDCNDQDNTIHPDAVELCNDGIDNNCNGLTDSNDPQAQNCPLNQICEDQDGDGFSPTGGYCGPLDCDDLDAARNPGEDEICSDTRDNDCDGLVDLADNECNGGDCLKALFEGSHQLQVELARWRARRSLLEILGSADPPNGSLTIRNAYSLEVITTATVMSDGRWAYQAKRPASVPCAVTVEYGRAVETVEIQDAPATCNAGDTDPGFKLIVSEVRWYDDEELRVSGSGAPARANLLFVDADSGQTLGSTRARRDGSYRFEAELQRPPCTLLILIEGTESGPYAVKDAPCESESDDDGDDREDDWDDARSDSYEDEEEYRDDD